MNTLSNQIRQYADDLVKLETGNLSSTVQVRELADKIRSLILTASVNRSPLIREAVCCADMLGRLKRLEGQ